MTIPIMSNNMSEKGLSLIDKIK